jgi:hypothetical protein
MARSCVRAGTSAAMYLGLFIQTTMYWLMYICGVMRFGNSCMYHKRQGAAEDRRQVEIAQATHLNRPLWYVCITSVAQGCRWD